jgi:hypothetical protein
LIEVGVSWSEFIGLFSFWFEAQLAFAVRADYESFRIGYKLIYRWMEIGLRLVVEFFVGRNRPEAYDFSCISGM